MKYKFFLKYLAMDYNTKIEIKLVTKFFYLYSHFFHYCK